MIHSSACQCYTFDSYRWRTLHRHGVGVDFYDAGGIIAVIEMWEAAECERHLMEFYEKVLCDYIDLQNHIPTFTMNTLNGKCTA